MSFETLLAELNPHQRAAATLAMQHALVLAGAGSGKTKTIVARAAFLISAGVPANRIQILTFTRRSASEIVQRVKSHLGEQASQLGASTFHTWCMSMIHRVSEWLTLANTLLTAMFAGLTFFILRANRAAVGAMREQMADQNRPFVAMTVQVRMGTPVIQLLIRNVGRTIALLRRAFCAAKTQCPQAPKLASVKPPACGHWLELLESALFGARRLKACFSLYD